MKNLKRTLALALVLCMLCSFLPAGALAAGNDVPEITGTSDAPFEKGTGGSNSFRIPALVTLSDGTLVAAADARWNTTYDGGGLDTMVAVSKDNGANWTHSFANYLGDNGNVYSGSSSCFIDPALAVTSNDTIYMLCDLYPYGVALNGEKETTPATTVGFNSNGKLLLSQDGVNFNYYLDGETIYNGSTPVSGYTVDSKFNVFNSTGAYVSNLFFSDSPFKVVRTGYLYLTKSTDKGATWSAPQLLNLKTSSEMVCLVGPGRGLVTSNGTIVFPVYSYNGNENSQRTGFIYSTDGVNWNRSADCGITWSSESAVVELRDGTLRFFFRNGSSQLKYVDYSWTNGWGEPQTTGIATNSNTQISAISLQKTIGDEQVILVSCPTGPNGAGSNLSGAEYRLNGKIFLFTVGDGNVMSKQAEVSVPSVHSTSSFMYSCLSALTDEYGNETGDIAILYEDQQNAWGTGSNCYYQMSYKTFNIESNFGVTLDDDINTDIDIDTPGESYEQDITLKLGETFTETVANIYVPDNSKEDDIVSVTWDGTEATHPYATANLGTNSSYTGDTIDVAKCLYTFTASGSGFVVQSKADPNVYLNTTKNGAGYPNATESNVVNLSTGNAENSFYLLCNPQNGENSGKLGYLHFYRNGDNRFDRVDNTTNYKEACSFYLYRPAEDGDEGSTEIPGYVRVTAAYDNVTEGEYLIAAEYSGAYYLLHPSTNTGNMYTHAAKVTGQTAGTDTPASTKVTIDAKAVGETTVLIGEAITYNVTVSADAANVVDVALKVGDTVTKTIEGVALNGSKDDTSIATVTWAGTEGGTVATKQLTAATLPTSSGSIECYITDGYGNFLSLNGSSLVNVTDVNAATLWTVTYNSYSASNPSPTYKITSGNYYIRLSNSTLVAGTTNSYNAHYYTAEKGFFCSSSGSNIWIYKNGAWTVGNDNGHSAKAYILETVTNEVDASTTVTFTGNAVGKTTAVVGNTLYNITVNSNASKTETVELMVGETKKFTDPTGNYENAAGNVQPNANIATMDVAGIAGEAVATVSTEKATALEAGATYIIRVFGTNYALSTAAGRGDWGTTTRKFEQNLLTANEAHMWTLEAANGGYKLKSNAGYLSLGNGNNSATLGNDGEVFTITHTDSGWTIGNQYGRYINALGGLTTYYTAGGWTADSTRFDLYKVTTSIPNSTEITFKGVAPGETVAVVGNTQYNITVKAAVVDIELEIGESFTYTDTTGNYVGQVTKEPDSTYATMTLAGAANGIRKSLVPVTEDTFTSNKRYVIESVRAKRDDPTNSVLTSDEGRNGLYMNGPLNENSSQTWQIVPYGDNYQLIRNNEYLTLGDVSASMEGTASTLSFEYVPNSGWRIKQNSYYLSDYEGANNDYAFGYKVKEDDGNYWNIYEYVEESVMDATKVTFTGVKEGKTTAIVGNIQYNITVVPAEVDDEVTNSGTNVWTVDPEEQWQRYNSLIGLDKDLYTDESWKVYETARQAAYKKLVEVTYGEFSSEDAANTALEELVEIIDKLAAAKDQLVSAMTISVNYKLGEEVLDIREYKVLSTSTTLTLPDTIVVDNILYKVTDTSLDIQGADTPYDVPVELVGTLGGGFVASSDLNVGDQTCDLVNNTGKKAITEMTLTTGLNYNLDLATEMKDGYTVTWSSDNKSVATVNSDGNVTAVGVGTATITATVKDAKGNTVEVNTIPVTVFPKGTGDRKTAIYIEEVASTTVWCVVNADTDSRAFEVVEGELIYGQFDTVVSDGSNTTAISFFGAPDEAHALVYMKSTNSEDHYYLLHDDNGKLYDGTKNPSSNYYVSGTNGGAGYWQAIALTDNINDNDADWTLIKEMVQWAIDQGCDGGLGFTRRLDAGNIASNLSFKSDPLPKIEKVVDGVLPTSRKYEDYRRYVEDMVAAVREQVYFKITITQEVPTEWKDAAKTEGAITYSSALLSDIVLPGSYLYTKELDQADGTWDGEVALGSRVQEDDVNTELNAPWTADQKAAGKRIYEYYLRYEIQESDIPKFWIDNIANLTYNYKSEYSTGALAAAADAEARISVVGSAIDNVVIDFGQSFTYAGHSFTSPTDGKSYTFTGLSNVHLKGAYVDGVNDVEGITQSKATAKYGDVKVTREPTGGVDSKGDPEYTYTVTYTPNSILRDADAVQIFGIGENNQEKVINGFLVYPATSVYYEEGFLNTGDWDTESAKKATEFQTFELLGMSQFSDDNRLTSKISNKKYPYGFDPIYDGNEDNGEVDASCISSSTVGDTAEFAFTGTGFELFANCTDETSYVNVEILNADNQTVKIMMVNTVVKGGNTDATSKQDGEMDALPIVSVKDLPHGDYTVRLTKIIADSKPVHIDGVRIFNTISESSVYSVDREENPTFYQLRDYVLSAIGIGANSSEEYGDLTGKAQQVYNDLISRPNIDSNAPSAVITDTNTTYGNSSTLQDLLDKGPKNEIYLWENQTLTFSLYTARMMQIGLKAPSGETSYTITIHPDEADAITKKGSIASTVDMFYTLNDDPAAPTKYVISITNHTNNVLSITDLKLAYDPSASPMPLTLTDVTNILRAAGYHTNSTEPDVPDASLPFVDVPEDSYYFNPVKWAVENGITSGMDATHFGPDAACTRAQVVTFLWSAANKPEPTTTVNPFEDVAEADYFYKAVLWAYENGITAGVDDTHFGPNNQCTRAQVVTFLWRAEGSPASSAEVTFTDVQSGDYYYTPVAWALENKVTSGMGGGTFGSDHTCTRAQVVTFLYAIR